MEDTTVQSDFLVKVAGIDGYFATKSGGDVTAATTDVYEGGQKQPSKLAGRAVTANVTVERPYHAASQAATIAWLVPMVGRWRTTVSVTALDENDQPVGDPQVYSNALLVRVNPPDADVSSNRESRWALEFAVQTLTA